MDLLRLVSEAKKKILADGRRKMISERNLKKLIAIKKNKQIRIMRDDNVIN